MGVLSTLPVVLFATRVMNVTVVLGGKGPTVWLGRVTGVVWPKSASLCSRQSNSSVVACSPPLVA
jgi:hypothetical protein